MAKKNIEEEEFEKLLNQTPWYKNGRIDYFYYPINQAAKECQSKDVREFRNACFLISSMAGSGRLDALFMLMGMFEYYKTDFQKLNIIADNLQSSKNEKYVNFLFDVFQKTQSSNSSRVFLDIMLKKLSYFNKKIAKERFQQLLEDKKYTYRMKNKFENILNELNEIDKY